MSVSNVEPSGARTIQNVLDDMSVDERELMDLIVGAALEDTDISGVPEVVFNYGQLTGEQKDVIDFTVGGVLQSDMMMHSDDDPDSLMHFGVKGMRWGVRNVDPGVAKLSKGPLNTAEGRRAARARVKAGSGTLEDAHVAGLKSTGHRAANAFLGDKAYWKRTALLAGGIGLATVASFAVPAVLPTSLLATIGAHAGGATVVTVGGKAVILNGAAAAAAGSQVVTSVGLAATNAVSSGVHLVNLVGNTARAVRGNARINKSYAALGNRVHETQMAGTKRVRKILNKQGSIAKKNLTHDDMTTDDYLAHYGIKGMRWGVRRSASLLGRIGGKSDKTTEVKTNSDGSTSLSGKTAKRLSAGQTVEIAGKIYMKRSDGKFDELSSEGAKFIKSKLKDPASMTDQELREHMARANLLKQYDDMFNSGDANTELRIDTEKFRLEADRDRAKKQRTQNRLALADSYLKTASAGFKAYRTLNDLTGGSLNKQISSQYKLSKSKSKPAQSPVNPLLFGGGTTKVSIGGSKTASAPATPAKPTVTIPAKVAVPTYIPSHRAPNGFQRFKAANTKPSQNTPSLLEQYKATDSARVRAIKKQPSLMEQVARGRHRKAG
jgi:hypothetical protein